tara:strand:+ start:74 stop:223 length:150 start_codon:yes stop_codon:yes gene_type:complete
VITNINAHSAMQQNESAWCSICYYAGAAFPGVAIMPHTIALVYIAIMQK